MQVSTLNTLSLEPLDRLLAQHRFGNSDYLTKQSHACYRRRLGKVSVHLPVAGQLLDILCGAEVYVQYRVFGDTAVRSAVQHALCRLVLQQAEPETQYGLTLKQCEEVFRATIRLLKEGKCAPLGSALTSRLRPDPYQPWIWSEERPDDVFAQTFRSVIYNVYDGPSEQLITPTFHETAMLEKGAQLLSELLPLSSRSALRHVHLIAVFPAVGSWTTRASSSEFTLSGTIFLNRNLISNPWLVAEHLLHEALHQQLYDFRRGHSLLKPDFDEGRIICSLWNVPDSTVQDNYWDIFRALAALHVYTHLALLSSLAEQRASDLEGVYGKLKMIKSSTALARAHYLAEQIKALSWEELGAAGKYYVDWFSSVLDFLDPSPPPQGSYVHLLLDRYRKESREVEFFLTRAEQPNFPHQMMTLVKEEIRGIRRVLVAMNAQADLRRFNDAVTSIFDEKSSTFFSHEHPGTQFSQVRKIIAKTILDVSQDGYTLSESRIPDQMIKEIIESSSESLKNLVGR